MREKILEALDHIRPALQNDGGDVELVDISEDGVVSVHFIGACSGCQMSYQTLKAGIEQQVMQLVPEVKEVISV